MKFFVKVALNSALGFIALFLFSWVGKSFGMSLGLNLFNALVIGVLGVPGFATLLIIQAVCK